MASLTAPVAFEESLGNCLLELFLTFGTFCKDCFVPQIPSTGYITILAARLGQGRSSRFAERTRRRKMAGGSMEMMVNPISGDGDSYRKASKLYIVKRLS